MPPKCTLFSAHWLVVAFALIAFHHLFHTGSFLTRPKASAIPPNHECLATEVVNEENLINESGGMESQSNAGTQTTDNSFYGKPGERVAVCICGTARTFYLRSVHENILSNVIYPLRHNYTIAVFFIICNEEDFASASSVMSHHLQMRCGANAICDSTFQRYIGANASGRVS